MNSLPTRIGSSGRHDSAQTSGLLARVLQLFSYLAHLVGIFMDGLASLFSRFRPSPTLVLKNRRLSIIKSLGEGGFSFVYLVRDASDGATYALKRVRLQLPEHEERFKAEVAAHRAVKSPYVVPMVDEELVKDGKGAAVEGLLLLPFFERGTVQDLIDRTTPTDFVPLARILRLAIDVCSGLKAFHSHDPALAFRDLKPANILINTEGQGVLMDLGSVAPARVTLTSRREALALQELCAETATAPFRAPELFDPPSSGVVDERTDVWALGCTIYAMAYRMSPFDGTTTATMSGRVSFPSRDPYGPAFRQLIESALATDYGRRPTVMDIQERCRVMLQGADGGDGQV
ncbi:Serine/threonine-protein kinase 16 [Thoreauomyces humboldtii]|nr:Serine/threonine-protein kinase 16 [Thoreauomyces humboldtii]